MIDTLPTDLRSPALLTLVARQRGVLARTQLTEHGVAEHRVRSQIEGRRWQAMSSIVIVLHNGPLTIEQKQWVAVLNAGPEAALCGRTAAGLEGMADCDDGNLHVVVRRGAHPPALCGVPSRSMSRAGTSRTATSGRIEVRLDCGSSET